MVKRTGSVEWTRGRFRRRVLHYISRAGDHHRLSSRLIIVRRTVTLARSHLRLRPSRFAISLFFINPILAGKRIFPLLSPEEKDRRTDGGRKRRAARPLLLKRAEISGASYYRAWHQRPLARAKGLKHLSTLHHALCMFTQTM